VDLDGTLVATDLTVEGIVEFLKAAPWKVLSLIAALLRGRPALKRYVARHVSIDTSTLPYRSQVLGQMREARAAGRPVLLVTASDQSVADAVGAHLGLVDEVVGTISCPASGRVASSTSGILELICPCGEPPGRP
jgi:phosphoserine phosphatase